MPNQTVPHAPNHQELVLTCPRCRRNSAALKQLPGQEPRIECSTPRCGFGGVLTAEQAAQLTAPAPDQVEQRPNFRADPNLSPRDALLSQRAYVERLKQLGASIPEHLRQGTQMILSDEEMAARGGGPVASEEDQRKERRIKERLARAGISPTGVTLTGSATRGHGYRF